MNEQENIIFLQKLGKRISEIRKAQNLTKVQLAFEINSSESSIRRIEKGTTNIGAISLLKISKALNVELSELFIFED